MVAQQEAIAAANAAEEAKAAEAAEIAELQARLAALTTANAEAKEKKKKHTAQKVGAATANAAGQADDIRRDAKSSFKKAWKGKGKK